MATATLKKPAKKAATKKPAAKKTVAKTASKPAKKSCGKAGSQEGCRSESGRIGEEACSKGHQARCKETCCKEAGRKEEVSLRTCLSETGGPPARFFVPILGAGPKTPTPIGRGGL